MKVLIAAFLVILFAGLVSAETALNIYVENDGRATFLGRTTDSITLPGGVSVEQGRISGTTNELTSKQGAVWTFSYTLPGVSFSVSLPAGAVILDTENVRSIGLVDDSIVLQANNAVRVTYRIETLPADTISQGLTFIGIALVLIAVTYWATHHYRKKGPERTSIKKKPLKDALSMLENVLNEREKLILNTLRETGPIKMSYLRQRCDIPKASFSRHIQELVKKKLITLSGEGKNKIISWV